MPIVIPREGSIPAGPSPLTQEQRDKLWEQYIRNWAQRHPDALRELKENTP